MPQFLLVLIMAFGWYKSVTIDHTQVGSVNLTDYPVTIFVTDPDLKTVGNSGKVQNSNGYDIRPFADSGLSSPLTFELVPGVYGPTTGKLEMHVKIPTISHTVDTVFYLAFGDSGISTDGSSTATWDDGGSNFNWGVWHFADGSTLSVADSSANGNNGTNTSATAATGNIDGGFGVTGGQHLSLPFPAISSSDDFTLSWWFNPNTWPGQYTAFPDDSGRFWSVFWNEFQVSFAGSMLPFAMGGPVFDLTLSTPWLIQFTVDGGSHTGKLYINGSLIATVTASGSTSALSADFGDNPSGGGTGNFDGVADEIRFAKGIARSIDWLLADYNNQKPSSTFISWGALTPVGGAGSTSKLSALGVG